MDEDVLAPHVEAIHGVPLDTFVTERDARVKQLRADGHRDEASALARRRKPTVAAWAVNQLPRRHPDLVDGLLDAGRDLHSAQMRATSGRGADGLREATRRLREAARDLTGRAEDILTKAGSASHEAEIEQTLFATATDPDRHEDLRRGILDRPVEVSGFGAMSALSAVPDEPHPDPAQASDTDTEPDEDAEAERRAATEREARRRDLEARRAELQRARVRLQRRVDRLETRADELQERLEQLQAEVTDAREAADRARDELDSLTADLTTVEDSLSEST